MTSLDLTTEMWIVSWCIRIAGVMGTIFGLVITLSWLWMRVITASKCWPILMNATAIRMHGPKHNKELIWSAIKAHVGDSDVSASIVIDYVKRLRPNAPTEFVL